MYKLYHFPTCKEFFFETEKSANKFLELLHTVDDELGFSVTMQDFEGPTLLEAMYTKPDVTAQELIEKYF